MGYSISLRLDANRVLDEKAAYDLAEVIVTHLIDTFNEINPIIAMDVCRSCDAKPFSHDRHRRQLTAQSDGG